MTAEVGDNTNVAEAQQILAESSGAAMQAVRDANGIDEQLKKLESGDADNTNSVPSGAKGNVEAGVYGDMGMAAVTGGSATVELVQTACKVVGESFDKNLGGMEELVESTKQQRSIKGPHVNDIFARASLSGGSMKDEIKGVKANETSITALLKAKDLCNTLQNTAECNAGLAKSKTAELGAKALNTQQMGGMAPGGNTANINKAPQLALNTRSPKGPTHMRDGDVDEAAGVV